MKKPMETIHIAEAVYPFEIFTEISDKAYWGEDLDYIKAIDGAVAEADAIRENVKITGPLTEGVMYIFRWTLKHDKLVPYHVTMKPKTAANIEKGSAKYGSSSIIAEL